MEEGSSLRSEYRGAVAEDETLSEWRRWGKERKHGYLWDDGVLKKMLEDEIRGNREVVVIPKPLRGMMMKLVHDQLSHVGCNKMLWSLKQACVWPGMVKLVRSYSKACWECQCMRRDKGGKAPMGEMSIYGVPFEHIAVDIVGPFPRVMGFKYLLTYISLSSRYPEAVPLKTATAMECAEALLDIFARNGVLDTLLSNQGTQFMSILTTTLRERLGIKQLRTTPYHPQTNGSVERLHGTLVPMLRKLAK